MKCECCRKTIINPYYLDGKVYGYNCYKKALALKYIQWEDERNKEYSIKCFSAMEIFKNKKLNSFHDSIVKQWNDCKKPTVKQLECIIKGFTDTEKFSFWLIQINLTQNEMTKKSLAAWIENDINKRQAWKEYIDNEQVNNSILNDSKYKRLGFHYYKDIEDDFIAIESNRYLEENQQDEYTEVLKVININNLD